MSRTTINANLLNLTSTPVSQLTVDAGITGNAIQIKEQGQILFYDSTNANNIFLRAPINLSASFPLILPAAQGAVNAIMANDGSGNLSFTLTPSLTSVTLSTPLAISSGGTGTASPGTVAGTGISVSGSFPTQTVALSTPVSVANGGTGTASPSLVAGTGISVTGSWPNQTVTSTASGGITQLTGDVTAGPGSGSQAATIANGAVTTAKLAANAVTNPLNSSLNSSNNNNILTTVNITTTGKPVLVLASASINVTPASGNAGVSIQVTREGPTQFNGNWSTCNLGGVGASTQQFTLTLNTIDTPPAGAHTYSLGRIQQNGSFVSASTYSLTVIELKA